MIRALARALPLVLLGLVLFARNRGGWADPLIDYGRELYLPWRIDAGQVLYRDFAYLDGPFSPYWNALWFQLGSVSVATLEWANLAVVATAGLLLHALLRRLGDARVAWTGVAVFLSIFAFNLIGRGGNMNWIAPYSHGITHGIVWALLSLWLLGRHVRSRKLRDLGGAGLALGMVFLTKPEVALAAAAGLGMGVVACRALWQDGRRRAARSLLVLGGCAALPAAVATLLLALAMPVPEALAGALGGWSHLARSNVGELPFYRWVMGIDRPSRSLLLMGQQALRWGLVLLPAFIVARTLRTPGRLRIAIGTGIALGLLLLTLPGWIALDWGEAFRPLAPCVAAFTSFAAWEAWRERSQTGADRAVLQLAFSSFALALLLKVLLQPVLWGYSFALAAPAMMVVVLALLHTIPTALERRGGFAWMFRGVALALLTVASLGCLHQSEAMRAAKTVTIGAGPDRMMADRRLGAAKMVSHLVPWVERHLAPDASVVVMPEGVIVNYLTRRPNPTRHLNFVPPEVTIFGEDRMLADLRAAAPDYVVLVQRDTREYHLPLFGTDYGRTLMAWVHSDYALRQRMGAAPLVPARLEDGRSGFELWERRGRTARP